MYENVLNQSMKKDNACRRQELKNTVSHFFRLFSGKKQYCTHKYALISV